MKRIACADSYLVLEDIEEASREMEAWVIIKSYDKGYLGHIHKETELMQFIQFELPEIMHLYDNEDDGEEEEYEGEEYEDEE